MTPPAAAPARGPRRRGDRPPAHAVGPGEDPASPPPAATARQFFDARRRRAARGRHPVSSSRPCSSGKPWRGGYSCGEVGGCRRRLLERPRRRWLAVEAWAERPVRGEPPGGGGGGGRTWRVWHRGRVLWRPGRSRRAAAQLAESCRRSRRRMTSIGQAVAEAAPAGGRHRPADRRRHTAVEVPRGRGRGRGRRAKGVTVGAGVGERRSELTPALGGNAAYTLHEPHTVPLKAFPFPPHPP